MDWKVLEQTIPTFLKNILSCTDKPTVLYGNGFQVLQDVLSTFPKLMKLFTEEKRKRSLNWTPKNANLKGMAKNP